MKLYNLILYIALLSLSLTLYSQSNVDKDVIIEETFLPLIGKEDSLKSIKALERDIQNLITKSNLKRTDFSVSIYSIDQDKFLYKKDENLPLTPASTTKIFTSFLSVLLSPDNKIKTHVYYTGSIIKGEIQGDLIIYGMGDPLLDQEDFDSLAVMIKNRGVKSIKGRILVDDSFFDDEVSRFKYSRDDDEVQKLAPITPLSIERNMALVSVKAHGRGNYLDVDVYPKSEKLKYLVYGKSSGMDFDLLYPNELGVQPQKYGDINPSDIAYSAPRALRISSTLSEDGTQVFVVKGNLRSGRKRAYRYYMKAPEIAAGGVLKSSLSGLGINTGGEVELCADYEIGDLKRKPLVSFERDIFEILTELNKNSDNYIAENLFKFIGGHNKIYNDNYHGTRDYTYKLMDSLNIPFSNCTLNDGSGLSRRNLLTTEAIVKSFDYISNQDYSEKFFNSLAIAGEDGTLRKRMRNTAAEEILIGKTGTLRNVSALAGITTSLDGENIAYAFIFNGNYVSKYKELENELGELISQFFYFNEEY